MYVLLIADQTAHGDCVMDVAWRRRGYSVIGSKRFGCGGSMMRFSPVAGSVWILAMTSARFDSNANKYPMFLRPGNAYVLRDS
jgi:hypothetical protein